MKILTQSDEIPSCLTCDNKYSKFCKTCKPMSGKVNIRNSKKKYLQHYSRKIKTYNLLEALKAIELLNWKDKNVINDLKDICLGVTDKRWNSNKITNPYDYNSIIVKELNHWHSFVYGLVDGFNLSRKEIHNIINGHYHFIINKYNKKRHKYIIKQMIEGACYKIDNFINPYSISSLKDIVCYDIKYIDNLKSELTFYLSKKFAKNNNANDVPTIVMKNIFKLLESHCKLCGPGGLMLTYSGNTFRIGSFAIAKIEDTLNNNSILQIPKNSLLKQIITLSKNLNDKGKIIINDVSKNRILKQKDSNELLNRYISEYSIENNITTIKI